MTNSLASSLRLRLLAVITLSLPACSDPDQPAAAAGAGGSGSPEAQGGAAGTTAQTGGTAGAQAGGTSGGGGAGGLDCQALHPDLHAAGSDGGGSVSVPSRDVVCYVPSAGEQVAGCLPSSSAQLLEVGYLNRPFVLGCNEQVVSAHGDPLATSGACDALPTCCESLADPDQKAACLAPLTTSPLDESYCALQLARTAPSCLPAPAAGDPVVCCYEVCAQFSCAGRPLVMEQGVRLATMQRSDASAWA